MSATLNSIKISDVKAGEFMIYDNHAYHVSEIYTSKTGKHGHAKTNFTATDLESQQKHEDIVLADALVMSTADEALFAKVLKARR